MPNFFERKKLIFLIEKDEKWVLNYLVSGKGTIPYSLKRNISEEEYENVKKFCKILKLKTLGDLNRTYNFQDTAILCEIFEERSLLCQKLFKYNAKKCNSASSFSGCVQRLKSKCSIALPKDAESVKVFEKTVMGGYSCVHTRVAFDTDLFLKNTKNEKVIFKTANGELESLSSNIIKMDENSQYEIAMTRSLPYVCIKLPKKYLVLKK